ncbi:agmatine deiminase family protein [Agrococcus baldri]|uniref:Agmatine deiminase n=1 Tax=Agrococcus baldri TaxID=153730 RepID=A0AA87RIV4_9MICO|nr:agmatine deiminase family protein [Agrococcus baldri]GEK80108.1 putative agmatine deiminase [Agrococcus baldri]
MAWTMPPEGAEHERLWMAFPHGENAGDDAAAVAAAHEAWAAVANAASEFEPVTVVVDPEERGAARRLLASGITMLEARLDDAWMRDIGPSFVLDEQGRLGAVDWVFNGWGGQDWASWEHDSQIGRIVAEAAGAERIPSSLVNEGGAIHVDGEGTVLLTETVQRDPGRNPGISREAVEAELARTIGATHPIWLPRGLTRDYERYGTRGHVDMVATLAGSGRVLVHAQGSPEHPDHEVTREIARLLAEQRDAAGRALEVIPLAAPAALRDEEGWVDWSYVNHVLVNGGIIACGFDDPLADAAAREALEAAYPGRRAVTIDAREIFARGGGIHCITQQQPKVPA